MHRPQSLKIDFEYGFGYGGEPRPTLLPTSPLHMSYFSRPANLFKVNRLRTRRRTIEGMKFRVVLEFDPAANSYSAVCPELPGCSSAGVTEDEARANIEEAIRLYLAPAEIALPDRAKLSEVTIG